MHAFRYDKSIINEVRCYCTCGQDSGWMINRQAAEDWAIAHDPNVLIARASLARPLSLINEARWYRSRAEDLNTPHKERALWRTLAEELEARLRDKTSDDDVPLFDMPD